MNHLESILVIGRNRAMMERVLTLLRNHQYTATGVLTDEDALREIEKNTYRVVVFGGSVERASREFIKAETAARNPRTQFIDAHPQTILEELKRQIRSTGDKT